MQRSANALAVIVRAGDGKLLMQHRTEDAPSRPGHWGFFGGGVEAGETPEQGLVRELFEELEYRPRSARLLFTHPYEHEGRPITAYVFLEIYDESQTVVLHEGQAYAWLTVEEALDKKISERDRQRLHRLQNILKELTHS